MAATSDDFGWGLRISGLGRREGRPTVSEASIALLFVGETSSRFRFDASGTGSRFRFGLFAVLAWAGAGGASRGTLELDFAVESFREIRAGKIFGRPPWGGADCKSSSYDNGVPPPGRPLPRRCLMYLLRQDCHG